MQQQQNSQYGRHFRQATSGLGSRTPLSGLFTQSPDWTKLFWSVLIDLVGAASFLIPGFGEMIDLIWAPIQTYLVSTMYGFGPLTALSFFEEILPGTDFIPTATIGWISQHTNIVPFFSERMNAARRR
eukprot:CFRG2417T1